MPRKQKTAKDIDQYAHPDKARLNNPPVGLVSETTEPLSDEKKRYEYDPHLDPLLQWAGKAEHTSFEVPTVSLHVHERIDPKTIVENVRKEETGPKQISLFDVGKKPLREAIEFYKHRQGMTSPCLAAKRCALPARLRLKPYLRCVPSRWKRSNRKIKAAA